MITKTKKLKIKKKLSKELSVKRKYKTTYVDINKYFKLINQAVFDNKLSPFNDIEIKDLTRQQCVGQVIILEWKRKGTRVYKLEMLPEYKDKKDFVDTLGHEMVHLYQMANLGDTGNHNKLFYSFGPRLQEIGLQL